MADGGRRPSEMLVVEERCIRCATCEELAPEFLHDREHVPVNAATLDAMAACPTGAIQWREAPRDAGACVATAGEEGS